MEHTSTNGFAQIHVGLGSCCMAKGSDQLFHALRESAGQCGSQVTIKRVGCMGMCHRTPMIEVALPGQAAAYYSDLTPGQAGALMQRYFRPRGFLRRAGQRWTRMLDSLLLEEAAPQQQVERFSMSKRDPDVRAFLEKQVHIATEHFGKLDPLDLDEYLAHDGFAALTAMPGIVRRINPDKDFLPRNSSPPSKSPACAGAAGRDFRADKNGAPSASSRAMSSM